MKELRMFSNGKRISRSILTVIAALGLSISAAFAQTGRVVIVQRNFMEEGPVDRSARELFNVGQKFYDQSRYLDAERAFREVIQKYPKSAIAERAGYYLIRTLRDTGKRTAALEQINAFPRTYPKSAWNADVQEIKIQLTNQVPSRAEIILLRQLPPPSPALPAAPVKNIELVASSVPSPPSPPAPRVSVFGAPQNADPQISWQQEVMRVFFRSDADRALQIAMERLKADMADPVVLSTLDAVAQSASTQALPFLLDVAKNSPNVRARKDAIFWMSQSRGNKDALVDTLTGLLPTMTDDDADAVTFSLGQVRTEKALNALAGIARDKNRSDKMRSSALLWIGQSGVPNRVSLLDDIYKNGGDSLQLRTQVLFALSQTHDPQAVSILGNIAASDPDFTLRRQAVMWLGQIRSPEATQALENLLRKK
jgi:tetratricopeptide (TPR) repeat protein